MTGTVVLHPLAVTLDATGGACVAGVSGDGVWLRPEPIIEDDVSGPTPRYRFFEPVSVALEPHVSHDPEAPSRPEDRAVSSEVTPAGPALAPGERKELLEKHVDASVEDAFAGERSAGLVRVALTRLYGRRSTGGKSFLRAEFEDSTGETFDWIVRDVRWVEAFPDPVAEPDRLAAASNQLGETYLAIGLTHPNGRFPGRFRGCHPLVVGVHSVSVRATTASGTDSTS